MSYHDLSNGRSSPLFDLCRSTTSIGSRSTSKRPAKFDEVEEVR